MKLRKLTTDDVKISITIEPEEISLLKEHFNSGDGDSKADHEMISTIREESRTNDWAWCCVTVKIEWNGFHEEDTVGCMSYKDEAEFRADGYFEDMVKTALSDLNATLELNFANLFELILPLPKEAAFQQLLDAVLPILPNASFDQDEDGQVVIHTNFKHTVSDGVETISDMGES
jgi:hypothetical protein